MRKFLVLVVLINGCTIPTILVDGTQTPTALPPGTYVGQQTVRSRWRAGDTCETLPDQIVEAEAVRIGEDGLPLGIDGLLTRADLVRALAERDRSVRIGNVMRCDCRTVEDTEMLDRTFSYMEEARCPTLAVTRGGELVGIVTLENIGEWMMIHSALRQPKSRSAVDDVFQP